MGNEKIAQLKVQREAARKVLAQQTALAMARAKQAEEIASKIWGAVDKRSTSENKRITARAKAQEIFDAGIKQATQKLAAQREKAFKKIDETYTADIATSAATITAGVNTLLADNRTPKEITTLTGLTAAEIRRVKTTDPNPSTSPTTGAVDIETEIGADPTA